MSVSVKERLTRVQRHLQPEVPGLEDRASPGCPISQRSMTTIESRTSSSKYRADTKATAQPPVKSLGDTPPRYARPCMAVPVRLSLYTSQPTATPSQLRSWRLTGQDKPRFARPAQEPAHSSTGVPANVGPGAAGGFAHASPQGQEAPRGREEWLPQAQAHPGGWQYRLQVPRGAKMHVDLVGKTLRVTADTRVGGKDGGKGQQSSLAWELPAGADPRHVQALMKGNILGIWVRRLP
ncbi:hypothetical protein ACKKBF_B37975 [Auxenochlorella protothecoides x Auxenochlorella symbiontica]